MGYYDFNDPFWSPHEACKQKSAIVIQEEKSSVVDRLQNWLINMGYSKIKSSKQENQLKCINMRATQSKHRSKDESYTKQIDNESICFYTSQSF